METIIGTQNTTGITPAGVAPDFVESDELRTRFALAMSAMYKQEVPLYGDLINIVRRVNEETLLKREENLAADTTAVRASTERLTLERHGAIRLGTPHELQTVKRIFAVLGMHPIGYYDLSVAGLPMHATCFRPTTAESLHRNPFRVFTTLLRPELLSSEEARKLSWELLRKRNIFTVKLCDILDLAESRGGWLREDESAQFIAEALQTFSWQAVAAATYDQYNLLKAEHPILADIACFQSAHINHLTPRTLDISAVQAAMKEAGMAAKSRIEGPPIRKCPILLRQTSFLALEEYVQFRKDGGALISSPRAAELISASHKARFGEIEERGAALTITGRKLYDQLLDESMGRSCGAGPHQVDEIATEIFKKFPDDWSELRKQRLIYCEYHCVNRKMSRDLSGQVLDPSTLEQLISEGVIEPRPITYEDFLPFSAAGIFQSNLHSKGEDGAPLKLKKPEADLTGFVQALKAEPMELETWYSYAQRQSLIDVAKQLGMSVGNLH